MTHPPHTSHRLAALAPRSPSKPSPLRDPRLLGGLAAVAAASLLVVATLPTLRRYLRIKSM